VITDPWCWITYSDFWSNTVTQFVGIADPTSPPVGSACALTNYAVDPLFVNRAGCVYSLSAGSPLRGAGDPADGSPNIGAFQDEDPPVGIDEAKKLPNGAIVEISNVIVTAVFVDGFYIEEFDRSAGIKVRMYRSPVSVGNIVNITGVMTSDGIERQVMNPQITINFAVAGPQIEPLGMTNAQLGGGSNGLQPAVSDWVTVAGPGGKLTCTMGEAKGVNNIGLFVKTWGAVKSVSSSSFTISDGAKMPVTVLVPSGVGLPPVGQTVIVKGISTVVQNEDGTRGRAVRVRSASDITTP
jgi:hypothetical protein